MAYSNGAGGKMSAVDAILAEAADLVALEQIARLNTAHLAGDGGSELPSSLESRFRKLKSLPAAAVPPPLVKTLGRSATAPTEHHVGPGPADPPQPNPPAPAPAVAAPATQEQRPEDAEATRKKESSPPQAHPPASVVPAVEEEEQEDLERLFGPAREWGRPTLRERNRGRDDDSPSPPPPRQACCFGFSPKKPRQNFSPKKPRQNFSPKKPRQRTPTRSKKSHAGGGDLDGDVLGVDAGEWGNENRRMETELKKALEEQVKVSRETAKMARRVKQASARMTHTAAIDDLLSDCDDGDDDELK